MTRVLRSRGAALVVLLSSVLVLSIACGNSAWCQEKAAGQPSQEEMTKQMMELGTPDQHHQHLARLVGTWKTTNKMWMGPEPAVSNGTATYTMILGGRILQSKHTGEWNGMPFEGMGFDGYDKAKQEYFSVWFDNMGTGMMTLTGKEPADDKKMVMTGTMYDPMFKRDSAVREEIVWTSDNSFTFTMYSDMPGPDGKFQQQRVMELTAVKQ